MNLEKVSPTEVQNRPSKQQAQGQHYLLLLLANQLRIPTPVKPLTSTFNTTEHTPMKDEVTPPVPLLRGIDRVGLRGRISPTPTPDRGLG